MTDSSSNKKDDAVVAIMEQARPVALNASFGSFMGFCSGVALKKTGKAVAYLVGITFVALQVAAAFGYVSVDWKKIQDDAVKKLDQTGDGKFDQEDAKKIWLRVKSLLTTGLPSAGGFSMGFLYGLKF